MKQITFTFILLMFFNNTFSQSDLDIISANCTEFDKENNCMAATDETTPINVYVNLTTVPEIAETDWFVEITRNVAYELPVIVNKDAFERPDEEGNYLYLHMLPIDVGAQTGSFTIRLNAKAEYEHSMAFEICSVTDVETTLQLDQQFLVYPNPIAGDFTLQYTGSQNEDIVFEVFDIQGSLIYETAFEQQPNFSKQINDLKLSKGIYFCSMRNAKFQETIKVEKL